MRQWTIIICVAMFLAACGKKGALLYPEMLVPAAPSNVILQQSGESMKLSFSLPSKDLAGRGMSNLTGVTILKRDDLAGAQVGCSACTDDYSLFKKLNLDLLPESVQRKGNLILLLDGSVLIGRKYSYIVSAETKEGVSGAPSAPVMADVVPTPAPPVLQISSQPTEIRLEIIGLPPLGGIFVGYNIYRKVKGETFSSWPLNSEPLPTNHFTDTGLERSTTYYYVVRSVVRISRATVESVRSNEVEGRLKDDE